MCPNIPLNNTGLLFSAATATGSIFSCLNPLTIEGCRETLVNRFIRQWLTLLWRNVAIVLYWGFDVFHSFLTQIYWTAWIHDPAWKNPRPVYSGNAVSYNRLLPNQYNNMVPDHKNHIVLGGTSSTPVMVLFVFSSFSLSLCQEEYQ